MPPINAWNVVDKYELAEILSHWHGGQDDPIYAVASSIGGNEHNLTKKIVQDALWNLGHDYRQAAKRHFKGISRGDAAELRYGIDLLQQVYDKMPDDGSEDMEPNGTPKPISGYAYEYGGKSWSGCKDDWWETVVLDPSTDGPFEFKGTRAIDGSVCNVWRGRGGVYFAQLQHMTRNAKSAFEKAKFKPLRQRWIDGEVKVVTWIERDRAMVGIQEVATGNYLAEWWDEDVGGLVEDGYFKSDRPFGKLEGKKFEESVIGYAEEFVIVKPKHMTRNCNR